MGNVITVVDALMGTGKSSWIIDLVNVTDKNKHILVVVPYKEQYRRLNEETHGRLRMIDDDKINKTIFCKSLVEYNNDIVITHALFKSLPIEIIQMLQEKEYMVIFDESPVVIEDLKLKKGDIALLKDSNRIAIDEDTRKVSWTGEVGEESALQAVQSACLEKVVYSYADTALIAMLPPVYLKGFNQVYICTYLFEHQLIAAYFKLFDILYEKKSLVPWRDGKKYLADFDEALDNRANIYALIDINQKDKHNAIGKGKYNLSKSNSSKSVVQVQLKKKFNTYYKSVSAKSEDVMWTVFKDAFEGTKGNGYTKGFIECNKKASNDYQDKSVLMYGCNLFVSPVIKNFISEYDIEINDEQFAVSELLQWIWRSRIRQGEPIQLYLPSKRMRDALKKWSNYEL